MPAYGIKYYLPFTNELQDTYEIFFSYDGFTGGITTLTGGTNPLTLTYQNNNEAVIAGIITLEAVIQIFVPHTSSLSFKDFTTDRDDEIYVYIKKGPHYIFHGWVVAELGRQQFKDAPYVIEVKCTDGLGLLKNVPLSSSVGTNLLGRQSLITIITGALSKANFELHTKTWCDIYHTSMVNRNTDPTMDMFSQTKVETRSFLASDLKYDNCYDVLQNILSQHFTLFYYLGSWHVVRVGDLQRTGEMNYVEYDTDAQIVSSGAGDNNTAKIGIAEQIFTHSNSAIISIDFAKKEYKLTFNYKIPENLVNNQKLTQLGSFIAPLNGYNIVGWTQKHRFLHQQTPRNVVTPVIRVETDAFGYEQQRYYAIGVDLAATNASNLKNYIINNNDDFFVDKDDRIDISFQYRYSVDLSDPNSTLILGFIAIHREGTDPALSTSWHNADANGFWQIDAGPRVGVNLVGQDTREWRTLSFSDSIIPQSGRMYLAFGADNHLPAGAEIHIKDISINYKPQIRGSFNQTLKGDFNRYEQNTNRKNSASEEVFVSDSPKRIISGSLYAGNGTTLLTPQWYRRGVTESKRYTQLAVLSAYNLYYRQFGIIEGTFKGYYYEGTTGGALVPIGPMTKFEFVDTGEPKQYIATKIEMDIKRGWFNGTFREIYDPALNDGNETRDRYEFNYIF